MLLVAMPLVLKGDLATITTLLVPLDFFLELIEW
jgi:hypothetical protein